MHFAWRDYAENVEGVASHSFVCSSQDKDAGDHRPKCSDMHASPGPGLHVSRLGHVPLDRAVAVVSELVYQVRSRGWSPISGEPSGEAFSREKFARFSVKAI